MGDPIPLTIHQGGGDRRVVDLDKLRKAESLVSRLDLDNMDTREDVGETVHCIGVLAEAQGVSVLHSLQGLILGSCRYALDRGLPPELVGQALALYVNTDGGQ